MSLDIRIDGRSVDLAAGSSLDLVLTNPHFDYSRIVGASANLPTFPLTRRNQQLFGYWEQPQAGSILAKRRLEQYYNGQLIREATYLLTEAGPGGYNGQMVELLGEFFGDAQNLLLSELSLAGTPGGTIPLPAAIPAVVNDGSQPLLAFPTIINPDFYGTSGASVSYCGRVNDYSSGYGNTPARPVVPMVFLKALLQKIALAGNISLGGEFLFHPAYSQLLVYNTRVLDGATDVTLAHHLPDMTVAELLLELRKLFNLKLDFDLPNRRLTIGFWQTALTQPATLDWSRKAVGRPLKTPEPNTRLQLGYELDGGDGLMKDKPALLADYLTTGEGGIAALKSKISTLLTDTATGTAKASQPGLTATLGQLNNHFAPRLLFLNGMNAGIPTATASSGNYSLYWTGLHGLYENHWQAMEAMRANQFYVKQSLNLTEGDLAGLRWERKVHLNGVDYFVLSVNVNLPIRKPAECLLVAA